VVFGGLLSATALTLVLLPAAYMAVEGYFEKKERIGDPGPAENPPQEPTKEKLP